jgi:hypothetical protein
MKYRRLSIGSKELPVASLSSPYIGDEDVHIMFALALSVRAVSSPM